jgi:glycerophosphoryl diester phosphodiesterase
MRCATGELVVVHDDDLGRVIGQEPGSGLHIRTSKLVDLHAHDVGHGERVPLLSDVFEELGPYALINIELKSPDVKTAEQHAKLLRDDGLAVALAELLRRYPRPPETTLVSSFDPMQLRRFHRSVTTKLPLGFLFHREQPLPLREAWLARLLPIVAMHPDAGLVDAVAMRRWRRAGHAVHVWTVDDAREVAALAELGVDAIITNRPGAVRAQLAAS